jgi:hypothetical protein
MKKQFITHHAYFFVQWATRWHVAFLALLAVLTLLAFSTMGVYVVSDDLAWVQRAAADAHQPWNAFVQPLFGDYYRPIPELVWTLNYCLWGFDFDGHQLMFILLWLAGVCAVYLVGCRLGGRIAGFAAATLVGLNYFYLLIASWKSWYTTLTEFVAVLACVWLTLTWLERRRTRYAIASAVMAVVAVLSRELAPLVISAVVLAGIVLPNFKAAEEKGRRRAVMWLVVWAVVTAAVLLALPSYRHSVVLLLKKAQAPAAAATGGAKEIPGEYVWTRFVTHTQGIFEQGGISRCLVWFAALFGFLRVRRERPAFAKKYHRVLLGALALGVIVLGLPWAVGAIGRKANDVSMNCVQPAMSGILMLLFCAVAFAGDRADRMLGAWFLAGFAPILLLEHQSGAYHLLAFAALALFTARALAAFVQEEFLPAVARLRGKAPVDRADDARYALVGFLAVLLISQAWTLGTGVRMAERRKDGIQDRVRHGRDMKAHVDRAIDGVLKNACPARQVWVAPEPYAELAGLILREKYGFKVQRLDPPDVIGLQAFDPLVHICTDPSRR